MSVIVYAIAIVSTIGWVLFMVFGAIGIVAMPLDWIRQFLGRPRSTITRSQYIDRARELARRAKDVLALADALKREERERGRSWRWRKNCKALNTQLLVLEEDEAELEMVYPPPRRPLPEPAKGLARARARDAAALTLLCPDSCLACLSRPARPVPVLCLQSEDPDYKWVLTVMGFWVKLFAGLIGVAISVCWVLQIILYILISPPVTPFLNTVFIKCVRVRLLVVLLLLLLGWLRQRWMLFGRRSWCCALCNGASQCGCLFVATRVVVESRGCTSFIIPPSPHTLLTRRRANGVFPLFGTVLFGIFVFYLQLAVIKGNFKFGLNLLIVRIHPMRPGATVMSSMLFNTALILLATTACIQFCAVAFALYADGTQVLNIFGNQVKSLEGLKYIYNNNIFIYCFLGFVGLTLAYVLVRGPDRWKRTKVEDVYAL